MRHVGPGNGNYIIDPNDPSGRIMVRVGDGNGDYLVMNEGIDNDGDGRINEDGIGGLDPPQLPGELEAHEGGHRIRLDAGRRRRIPAVGA